VNGYWLAIDTATDVLSVAAGRDGVAETGGHSQGARRHAAEIISLVDVALGQLGIRPQALDGIVIGDGPGSFTGLRIGWAAAKGLVQDRAAKLVAVPSLLAAAATAAQKLGAVPVAACFDALRGQVYGAVYVIYPGRVDTLVPPTLGTISELATKAPHAPRVVVGDGAWRYADDVMRWSGTAPMPPQALLPAATLMLSLAAREGASRTIDDPATAEPVYGRPAEAQAKWEARHGRALPHPPGTSC
jgi:tRNA threonylcarbamoyladenosine biosynthesis protein TsaB